MPFRIIILSLLSLLCALRCAAQGIDTAALDRRYQHCHRIHEDSAEVARAQCLEILRIARKAGYAKGQGDACLTLGVICRNKHQFPESYRYLRQSLQIRRSLGDSNRVAAVFTNLAINMSLESRYDSAIATVLYAIKIIEELPQPDYSVLGSEYQLLSNICGEYLEPEDALKYARRSLQAYEKTGQSDLLANAAYTLGNRMVENNMQDSALIYYDLAYNNFLSAKGSIDYLANILVNKATICCQKRDFTRAAVLFDVADSWLKRMGPEADNFHFYLNKGDYLITQNDWSGGLELLQKAMPSDISELSFTDQQFLFENMAEAYAALGMADSAYFFLQEACAVRDSISNDRKRKEYTRFHTERYKKESVMEQARADTEAARAQLYWWSSLLLLLLFVLIAYAYLERKRSFQLINRQRETLHKQEVDELIQNSELRYLSAGLEGRELEREQIARELHDRLGSAVVTLSWQYDDILEQIDPDSANYQPMLRLNDSLKFLYQDIRQIAHQLGSGVLERAGLVPVLTELCHTIEAGKRMDVNLSFFGLEHRLGFTQEINILRIVQELISNVLKYAQATQLMIQINKMDDLVNIMVEDNGRGFDPRTAQPKAGVGLSNIESRLRTLNGTIQYESRPAGGTTVIINIPLPKPENFYDQAH